MSEGSREQVRGSVGRHGLLFAAVRLAGWLVVPLFVASAGYLLENRAGLWENEHQATNLALTAGFGAFAVVGTVLAIKRPANPIGWIMAAIASSPGYPTRATPTRPT